MVASEEGTSDADKSGQERNESMSKAVVLINDESLNHGFLDAEESSCRSIFKIDIGKNKRGMFLVLCCKQDSFQRSLPRSRHGK